MNTPGDASDSQINELVETLKDIATPFGLKPVNAETVLSNMPYGVSVEPTLTDHPLAAWLFQHFKPGSDILTKPKAYEIANELNRLLSRVEELEHRLGLPQGGRDDSDDDEQALHDLDEQIETDECAHLQSLPSIEDEVTP